MTRTVKIIEEDFDPHSYDACAAHPAQSWSFGLAREKLGTRIIRFGEFEGSELKKSYLMTIHSVPLTKQFIGVMGMCHTPAPEVIAFLTALAEKEKFIFIKIEPYAKAGDTDFPKSITYANIRASSHPLFFRYTEWINLEKSEEEIMQAFDKNVRYDIRNAEKKGVSVKEMNSQEGFDTFFKLYASTVHERGFFGHGRTYHEAIWKEMHHAGIARILIASFGDVPISATELFYFNNALYYPYSGSDSQYRAMQGSTLVLGEATKFGKRLGAQVFDLWGADDPEKPAKKAWRGFSDFKKGFGTETVKLVGSFDLVFKPALYSLYTMAFFLRRFMLKLKGGR